MRLAKLFTTVVLLVMLAVTLVTAGCNTVKGAGKDLEEAGKTLQGE